jgi:hypothetical protein
MSNGFAFVVLQQRERRAAFSVLEVLDYEAHCIRKIEQGTSEIVYWQGLVILLDDAVANMVRIIFQG